MAKLSTGQIRQGDVLLVRTEQVVTGETEHHDNGELVLAHGEVTGHKHRFVCDVDAGEVVASRAARQLTLVQTRALLHEEHSPIEIPAGRYDLPRQTEWTDDLEPRQVQD